MGNCLLRGEKLSLWCTCTALVWCLVFTMLAILGLGVGLGYNFCFVDMKTRYRYVPAHYNYAGNLRYPYPQEYPPPYPPEKKGKIRTVDDVVENLREALVDEYQNMDYAYALQTVDDEHVSTIPDITFENVKVANFSNYNTTTPKPIVSKNATDIFRNTTESANKESNKTISLSSIIDSEAQTRDSVRKMVIPVTGLDIIELLSKLRANNKSYYLQIVTN